MSAQIKQPQLVTYMNRPAQIIGKQYGSRYSYSRAIYYDLKMMDSGFVFRRINSNRCTPCEAETQALRLVKV